LVQGPKTDEAAILNVWNDGEDLELQFSEIAEKTKAVVSERTLISYLKNLIFCQTLTEIRSAPSKRLT